MHFPSHDAYLRAQPVDIRRRLELVQKEVEARVPGATRTISYNMPAFKNERVFFYFAAYKKHIGIYPPVTKDLDLISETQAFRGPKGNLSFPHDQQLPLSLIGRIAVSLSVQYKTP